MTVADGNDTDAIDAALQTARVETSRPSLILVRTHIGYGSPNKHDSYEAHGSPLGVDEVRLTKRNLGWPEDPHSWFRTQPSPMSAKGSRAAPRPKPRTRSCCTRTPLPGRTSRAS